MKIAIINGPNLNLTGKREPEIYGFETFEQLLNRLKIEFPEVEVVYLQSNVEGELLNMLHDCNALNDFAGIILNAGAYTHTSMALGDAVSAIDIPVIEVHMSNIFAREDFRHVSYVGRSAVGTITGFGMDSYRLAVIKLIGIKSEH